MKTRVNKLTGLNIRALKDLGIEGAYTATTAEWGDSPAQVIVTITDAIKDLPANEHPRKSTYAVLRKLRAIIDPDGTKSEKVNGSLPDSEPEPKVPGFEPPAGVSLREGAMIQLKDWDGSPVWLRIQGLGHSKEHGPTVRGIEYLTEKGNDGEYVGQRELPLSTLVDPAEEARKLEERKAAARARGATQRRVGGGVCEHCGERTGGGRFLAGHDAKLKGDLKRAAKEGDAAATAEAQIRAAQHREDDPESSAWWTDATPATKKEVAKLVKQGDGFLRSRITQRIGQDPGRIDSIRENDPAGDGLDSLRELMTF